MRTKATSDASALKKALSCVRAELRGSALRTEADVISKVIMPLLQSLGWGGEGLKSQVAVAGGFADIVLTTPDGCCMVIEAKGPGERLEPHEGQLATYGQLLGAEQAVLSNGLQWRYYLPKEKGPFEKLCFVNLDLSGDAPATLSKRFVELFSPQALDGARATAVATKIREEELIRAQLRALLWEMLRRPSEPLLSVLHEDLAALLRNKGFKQRCSASILKDELAEVFSSPQAPQGASISATPNWGRPKPTRIVLSGTAFAVGSWKQVLITTATWLLDQGHPLPTGGASPTTQPVVALSPAGLHQPTPLGQYWLNTHGDSETCVKRARWLMQECGYAPDAFEYSTS